MGRIISASGRRFLRVRRPSIIFRASELLRAVAGEIRLPAFAVGGISKENLGQVRSAGFGRIAVGGAVLGAEDPVQAAKEIKTGLSTEK